MQNDVYICFIDYTKAAFDRVIHSKMIDCRKEVGIDDRDLQIITKMNWEHTAVVKTDTGLTEEFKIKKGVPQRCMLSASVLNLYTEEIFREIDNASGVVIGGTNINNNKYAADAGLMATTAADLQELTTEINEKGRTYGMEINVKKSKTMVVSKKNPVPDANILIDETPIEQETSMVYLGHMVKDGGKSDKKAKRRIEIARNAYKNFSTILSSRDTSIHTRKRIVKCYVWAKFLYGSETWTITKSIAKEINAFKMWIYRRMFRIPWTAYKSNNEIFTMIGNKQLLLNIVKQRQVAYFRHVIRRDGNSTTPGI